MPHLRSKTKKFAIQNFHGAYVEDEQGNFCEEGRNAYGLIFKTKLAALDFHFNELNDNCGDCSIKEVFIERDEFGDEYIVTGVSE